MLLYAFIGGLILNIMPCVLPVIALKILGFINHAQHEPRRVRALGLIYAARRAGVVPRAGGRRHRRQGRRTSRRLGNAIRQPGFHRRASPRSSRSWR